MHEKSSIPEGKTEVNETDAMHFKLPLDGAISQFKD